MKLSIAVIVATFCAALGFSDSVKAEPISVRGINWSMSIAEQIHVIEDAGMACVFDTGWNVFLGPIGASQDGLDITCIQSGNNDQTIQELHRRFSEWSQICSVRGTDGYATSECLGFNSFYELFRVVRRIHYKDDRTIEFDCRYLGTCGFEVRTIVSQLQAHVIDRDFLPPTADSWIGCADGDDGDAICVHMHTKNILLLRNPMRDNMQF
ncbi:hypothetical protein [Pararhodobacter oceanensis]|uniref:Uncharacterized protein n=1 Tax=Pararhodobacter oceanensis TaxID=2172121 RepID=A0A2T8HP75_9RHOB|nr:hypothetical protein [Pararhodobacter oceanensis]PVH27249.1 hypothetical protein DDE20_18625 [Pararhodobacter oceanensis]